MILTASYPARAIAHKPHALVSVPKASKISASMYAVSEVTRFNKQNKVSVSNSLKTLSAALQCDPLTQYLAPDLDEDAARKFVAAYASDLLSSVDSAELLFHTSAFGAAALAHKIPEEMALLSAADLPSKEEAQRDRVKALNLQWNSLHQHFLQDHGPYIYISMMGVHPDKQRQGLGGQLLKTICAIADKETKWCYLEATPLGVDLYLKKGFVPLHESQLGPEAPLIQHMGRPPR